MSLLIRLSIKRKYMKILQFVHFNKTLKCSHILLAAYLFSLRVLLDFFRQPSHTKLNERKEKKGRTHVGVRNTFQNPDSVAFHFSAENSP